MGFLGAKVLAHFNLFNREVILYKFGAIARRTKIEHAILRLYVKN